MCDWLEQVVRQSLRGLPAERGSGLSAVPDRCRAAMLLARLAEEAQIPLLRQLLRNRCLEQEARTAALSALCRLRAELPAAELQELLDDPSFWDEEAPEGLLIGLLSLFRSEEAQQIARAFLERLSPEDRARLLIDVGMEERPVVVGMEESALAPQLLDWLYGQWLHTDRLLLADTCSGGEPLNVRVAAATQERAGSSRLLIEAWRQTGEGSRNHLLRHLWDVPGEVAAAAVDSPAEMQVLADSFVLTHADLRRYFGSERLLQLIETRVLAMSRRLGNANALVSAVLCDELTNAFDLLSAWPDDEADDLLCALISEPALNAWIRGMLTGILWSRRPDRAAEWALGVLQDTGNLAMASRVLREAAHNPWPRHCSTLLWMASWEAEPEFRYLACHGLEVLGEDSPEWRQRLQKLSRDADPFVRLLSTAALVRRGEEGRRAEIVRDATEATDVCVRAEALRALGRVDAQRHFHLLRRALLEDHEAYHQDRHHPAAQEAARALAHLGTPEAMTVLIQGYFLSPGFYTWVALESYLAALVSRLDGGSAPLRARLSTWREKLFRHWHGD